MGIAHQSDPVGRIDLTDMDLDQAGADGDSTWACLTISVSVALCSPKGTGCGSCSWGTAACC